MIDRMGSARKEDVNYSVGMKESHCGKVFKDDNGYCQHFYGVRGFGEQEGRCRKVAGKIDPVYWCKLWEKAK